MGESQDEAIPQGLPTQLRFKGFLFVRNRKKS